MMAVDDGPHARRGAVVGRSKLCSMRRVLLSDFPLRRRQLELESRLVTAPPSSPVCSQAIESIGGSALASASQCLSTPPVHPSTTSSRHAYKSAQAQAWRDGRRRIEQKSQRKLLSRTSLSLSLKNCNSCCSEDWHSIAALGEVQGYGGVCSSMEARGACDVTIQFDAITQTYPRSETRKGGVVCTAPSRVDSPRVTSTQWVPRKARHEASA
jgi:hypothetical protein